MTSEAPREHEYLQFSPDARNHLLACLFTFRFYIYECVHPAGRVRHRLINQNIGAREVLKCCFNVYFLGIRLFFYRFEKIITVLIILKSIFSGFNRGLPLKFFITLKN